MTFEKDKVYQMKVKRTDFFNGRRAYIAEYEGAEYRIKMYAHQSPDKTELSCVYIGENSLGKPQFQQEYASVLYELYEEGCTYPFTVADNLTDMNTGAQYYLLMDEYGFRHRVYNQELPLIKAGDKVQCRIVAVESKYLSMEILPKETPKTSFSLGEVLNISDAMAPAPGIVFSQLDPESDTTLRDYQIENKRKIYLAWQSHRSIMLQMPTGTGKTRLFVSIARDLFEYGAQRKKATKVLFLAHRKELIEQISEHVGMKYGLAHGLILSQNVEQKKMPIQVGSVPTLNRRLDRWEDKNFDVIIIDEAHHVKAKSYKNILNMYPQAKILGVTATPYRLNGAAFRPEFEDIIISPSVAEFIKRKYLSEYVYYSIRPDSRLQHDIDRMKLDFEGDYKESEMMGIMDRDYIRAGILTTYRKYARDRKGIIYTISRAHNQHLCAEFNEAGITAAAIDSETPKEKRDALVGKFRRGEIQVLLNVNIFSEGFDCPDVEVIQLARPTKSLALYLQQVGRGFRPAEGKESLLVLDNVGLYNKFGFPSARRKWRYHFEGRPVDETPQAHMLDEFDEEREVKTIFEGDETVEILHDSHTEVVEETALDDIQHDYEQSFIAYAKGTLNERTAKSYARSIRPHLDDYIRKHFAPSFDSLFTIIDENRLKEICEMLKHDQDFSVYNASKHNAFSAALARYRAFAEWYAKQDAVSAPSMPIEEGKAPIEIIEPDTVPDDAELDAEIESFEKAVHFFVSRNMPVPSDVSEGLKELEEKKKKNNQGYIVRAVVEGAVQGSDLSDVSSFRYNSSLESFDVEYLNDPNEILKDERDIEDLERIMGRFNLELPQVVVEKKMQIESAKATRETVRRLRDFIRGYIADKKSEGVYIDTVAYDTGGSVSIEFGKSKPIGSSLYSIPHTRSRSYRLKVIFADGTVICEPDAIDTYVKALNKMGPDNFRSFSFTVAKRPLLDKQAHPRYKSYRLHSGDWVCGNLPNEKKALIINKISEKYNFGVEAVLV